MFWNSALRQVHKHHFNDGKAFGQSKADPDPIRWLQYYTKAVMEENPGYFLQNCPHSILRNSNIFHFQLLLLRHNSLMT